MRNSLFTLIIVSAGFIASHLLGILSFERVLLRHSEASQSAGPIARPPFEQQLTQKEKLERERESWMLYGKYCNEIEGNKRVTLTGLASCVGCKAGGLLHVTIGNRGVDVIVSSLQYGDFWSAVVEETKKTGRSPQVQVRIEGVLAYSEGRKMYYFDQGKTIVTGDTPFDNIAPDAAKVVSWKFGYRSDRAGEKIEWSEWIPNNAASFEDKDLNPR